MAGGLSKRMHGRDKGLQHYNGQAMARWVYQALEPYVNTIYINCNQNQHDYREICSNLCSDTIKGFQGPLAGIVSLMAVSSADYLLISPCDTPLLSADYGRKMVAALRESLLEQPDKSILLASKDADRSHPLHMLISNRYRTHIEQAIHKGENRVMQWVRNHDVQWLDFSQDQHCFTNFNSPESFQNTPKQDDRTDF